MILYKYYPCNEYTFRALSEMGLWCSPTSNMNDPFDCLGDLEAQLDDLHKDDIIRQFRDTLTKIRPDYKYFEWPHLVNLISSTRKKIIEGSIFCSLTENQYSNVMWAHYANSHKGIVIGLELPDKAGEGGGALQKIHYTDTPPIFDPKHYLNMLKSHELTQTAEITSEQYESILNIVKSISVKTLDWNYEDEWRYWALSDPEPKYRNYEKEQLKSVYFGLRCPQETKTLVKSILRGHGVSDDVYHDIKVKTDPKIELYV